MQDLLKALQKSNRRFYPLIKKWPFELFGLFLFCDLLDQYFKFMASITSSSGVLNFPALFGRLTVSLLLMLLLTHWVPLRVRQLEGDLRGEGLFSYISRHVRDFTLESLRAMGHVLLFTLMLILPGLWKYVQYILVPYVVLVDPDYKAGQVDALAESKKLMKGFNLIGTLLILLAIPAVMVVGQWTEPIMIAQDPLKWLLNMLGLSLLSLYLNLLLFEFYRVRKTGLTSNKAQ